MKDQAINKRLGMLQYFLDATVQVATDIEQQQGSDDGEVHFAKLAYQGILLDYDDTWVVLGYYDQDDGSPTIVASIKIANIVAVSLTGLDDTDFGNMSGAEVN